MLQAAVHLAAFIRLDFLEVSLATAPKYTTQALAIQTADIARIT